MKKSISRTYFPVFASFTDIDKQGIAVCKGGSRPVTIGSLIQSSPALLSVTPNSACSFQADKERNFYWQIRQGTGWTGSHSMLPVPSKPTGKQKHTKKKTGTDCSRPADSTLLSRLFCVPLVTPTNNLGNPVLEVLPLRGIVEACKPSFEVAKR